MNKRSSSSFLTLVAHWWRSQNGNVRGGLWMLLAAFLFSIMVAIIKTIGGRIPIVEVLFFRQLTMTLFVAPMVIKGLPGSLISKRPDLQLIRVLLACTAMVLGFSAFIHLPLAQATAIGFSKTMFITLLAVLMLKEKVGLRRFLAVLAGFMGVLIMIKPQAGWLAFSDINIWSLAALAGAAAAGCVMVIIRKLTTIDQPITILTYQAAMVGLLMLAPTLYYWVTPTGHELMLLALLGGFSVLAQMSNIRAYKAGEATAISSLDYTRLIYASAFGFFLFMEVPQRNTLIGATIIIAASLYTLHREAQLGKKLSRATQGRIDNP